MMIQYILMKFVKKIQELSKDISLKDKDVKKKEKKVFILLGEILIYKVKYFYLEKNSEFVIVMILQNSIMQIMAMY